MGWRSPRLLIVASLLVAAVLTDPQPANAWGDEGHKVIALIAEHYLDPALPPVLGFLSRSTAIRRLGWKGWASPETTMISESPIPSPHTTPLNKGRLIGQKRPLKPQDVRTIRVRPPAGGPGAILQFSIWPRAAERRGIRWNRNWRS